MLEVPLQSNKKSWFVKWVTVMWEPKVWLLLSSSEF